MIGNQGLIDREMFEFRSEFQREVLEVVMRIGVGEVWSYERVAREIGKVKAVRAVASAIARNPYPVMVPCHRVVRKNGFVGEYLFGREKKIELLLAEGVLFDDSFRVLTKFCS